jgi:hypothetical protein
LTFYRQEQQALTQAEKDNFTRFCAYFAGELLPYIQKCLHAVFPPTVIASHLGVTVQHLQKQVYTKHSRNNSGVLINNTFKSTVLKCIYSEILLQQFKNIVQRGLQNPLSVSCTVVLKSFEVWA